MTDIIGRKKKVYYWKPYVNFVKPGITTLKTTTTTTVMIYIYITMKLQMLESKKICCALICVDDITLCFNQATGHHQPISSVGECWNNYIHMFLYISLMLILMV